MPKKRLLGLCCVLLALIGYCLFFVVDTSFLRSLTSSSVRCSEGADERLIQFLKFSHQLRFDGAQAAFIDAEGHLSSCAMGWADFGFPPKLMTDKHRLRYASLSKLLTTGVVLQLIAEQKIAADDHVVDLLELEPPFLDPRVGEITVAHLLRHTSGFDRAISGDAMFAPDPWCPNDLKRFKKIRLDHEPGSYFSYSNLGYCLLGAIATQQSGGVALEQIIRSRLLAPVHLSSISAVVKNQHSADEPSYFFSGQERLEDLLSIDYGSNLASGGWGGNAQSFAFLLKYYFSSSQNQFPSGLFQEAFKTQAGCDFAQWRHCHVFGFYKYGKNRQGDVMFWRDGSLPGVSAFAAVFSDGAVFVFLANTRLYDWKLVNDQLGLESYRLFAN